MAGSKPGERRGGRKKGTPNKLTASVKEAFEIAFNELQQERGVRLTDWARKNTTEFYKLAARLIPTGDDPLSSAGLTVNMAQFSLADGLAFHAVANQRPAGALASAALPVAMDGGAGDQHQRERQECRLI